MIATRTGHPKDYEPSQKKEEPIGKFYEGVKTTTGLKTPIRTINKNNYREASEQEEEWYYDGARTLPKYSIGNTVKIIYTPNSDNELLYSTPKSQLGLIGTIDKITFSVNNNYYIYYINNWWVAETNLALIPKYASTYPMTPDEAFKPFDKDNFLVSYGSMPSFRAYMELCDEYNIATHKTWKGVENYHYGVKNGEQTARLYFEKVTNEIPKYTFNEFKQILTNKIQLHEVQEKITTKSGRLTNQVYKQNSRNGKITSASRLIGNKISTSRGRATFGKFKKLQGTIHSSNSTNNG